MNPAVCNAIMRRIDQFLAAGDNALWIAAIIVGWLTCLGLTTIAVWYWNWLFAEIQTRRKTDYADMH